MSKIPPSKISRKMGGILEGGILEIIKSGCMLIRVKREPLEGQDMILNSQK
jgi:hypothetical protein